MTFQLLHSEFPYEDEENLISFLSVLNMRSCHLRLTLGRAPLCMYICTLHNAHNSDRQKSPVRPPCSILDQYEPWTVPYLNRR